MIYRNKKMISLLITVFKTYNGKERKLLCEHVSMKIKRLKGYTH